MSDLSPESRALLRGARADFEPSDAERVRVDDALAARLGIAAGTIGVTASLTKVANAAGSGGAATGAAAAAVPATILAAKWIGVVLLVASVGAGSVYVERRSRVASSSSLSVPTPPSARVASVSPPASVVEPLASAEVPSANPLVPASPRPHSSATSHVVAGVPSGTVADETRLLRRADEALRNDDGTRALALLDEHARTFPNGVLGEERSAERVATLCRLGRVAEAHAEAIRFLRRTPNSPLADGVRGSCAMTNDDRENR